MRPPFYIMSSSAEEIQSKMSINKETPMQSVVDHNYTAFLECRFKGTWQSDSAGQYTAVGDDSELRLIRIDGMKKYLAFKSGARVSILFPNVVSYDQSD